MRNLLATLRHKWFVLGECYRMGILWQGIVHDLDKFLPAIYRAYNKHFYVDGYIQGRAYQIGGDRAFDRARNAHVKANKHHWEYWCVVLPGAVVALPIPDRYRREMLADWRAAGRGYDNGNPDTRAWYANNRQNILLHPETRKWIERELA